MRALLVQEAMNGEFVESAVLLQSVVLPWLKVTVPAGLIGVAGDAVSVTLKLASALVVTAPEGTVVKAKVAGAAVTVWPPVKDPELSLKAPSELR